MEKKKIPQFCFCARPAGGGGSVFLGKNKNKKKEQSPARLLAAIGPGRNPKKNENPNRPFWVKVNENVMAFLHALDQAFGFTFVEKTGPKKQKGPSPGPKPEKIGAAPTGLARPLNNETRGNDGWREKQPGGPPRARGPRKEKTKARENRNSQKKLWFGPRRPPAPKETKIIVEWFRWGIAAFPCYFNRKFTGSTAGSFMPRSTNGWSRPCGQSWAFKSTKLVGPEKKK